MSPFTYYVYFAQEMLKQFSDLFYSGSITQKGYSSHLSFTVTDINSTVTKLKALGAELDGPIKFEIHGKAMILIPFF